MRTTDITVIKANRSTEPYSEEKLRRSLLRTGVGIQLIDQVLSEMRAKLYNGIPTQKIHALAFKLLKKHSQQHAARYDLKKAIMSLGPSGFPFENYIAALFESKGYQVKTKQLLPGVCVTHEIDVLAENEQHVLLMECKYHNSKGTVSDVKVPLYIHSRYRDVLEVWNKSSQKKSLEGWVVTNTKFSSDAVKYGTCAGLHLLGWNFPEKKSLARLVDESALYPVTCLTTLTNSEKIKILEAGIVLCKSLENNKEVLQLALISNARIPAVMNEVKELCKL